MQFVIVWCLPTVLNCLTGVRARRNLKRLEAFATDADVAQKQKQKAVDAPSMAAAAAPPPDDWVLVSEARANTAAVPSMSWGS